MTIEHEKGKNESENKYLVQSVGRSLQILTCFNLSNPKLSLINICEMTGLPKPTVFRLLSTLEFNKFVERTADKLFYTVGIRLFELGNVYLANLSLERVISPYMQRITQKFNISCNLAILDDGQVVYIASAITRGPFQYAPIIGFRHFIHCSALGKALVMDLPEDIISSILEQKGMHSLSTNTITEPKEYFEDLAKTRNQGYMVDDQEGSVGIYCMAVPIRNRSGQVIAAISVSGPSPLYTEKFKKDVIQELKDIALEAVALL